MEGKANSQGVRFDLSDLNLGTWFEMEGGGRVCLRVCAGDDLRAIRKATSKKRADFRDGRRIVYDDVNEEMQNEMIWDHCIVSWENLLDKAGKPIPCTKETKNLLMGKSITFSSFVGECLKRLFPITESLAEELEKN